MSFINFSLSFLISVELFKEYITPKDASKAPHTFTDCAKIYSECRAPNEQPLGVAKKKKLRKNKSTTTTPSDIEETTIETNEMLRDVVSQYVQQSKK